MPPIRSLAHTLVCLAALACATKPGEPVAPEPIAESPAAEPAVVIDACAERSLEAALAEGRAALGPGEAKARLGLAIEQALACEARARNWELELEAVKLLAQLDPIPDPGPTRCRTNSEGVCIYKGKKKKKQVNNYEEPPAPIPYDEIERARLDAYARYETEAAPGEALRSIRERHIRLRLAHRDFEIALMLLQDYVVDYHEHESAVGAALALVDTLVNAATVARDTPPNLATSALAWFDRLATLELWQHPAAAELHERIAELRPGLMWRAGVEARDAGRRQWHALEEAGLSPAGQTPDFRRCAEIFVEIYNAYPEHDRADTLLWNAADCFDASYDFGQAYAIRMRLIDRYPDSYHYEDTLYYLAEMDHATARYDKAARHYLNYARLYPKDSRSVDALVWAYRFADALGHDTSEVVDDYVRLLGRKDVKATGKFVWESRPAEPQELLEFALEFVKTYGNKAGVFSYDAIQVVAELSWAKACRGRLDDGLCVESRSTARADTCPLGGTPLPRFRPRNRKLADEARGFIKKSAKLSKHHSTRVDVWEAPLAARIEAASSFLAVEPALEEWLIAGPNASDARERAMQLDARYRDAAALDIDYAIRAHARRGLIWEVLATPGLGPHEGACLPATAWAEGDRKRALSAYARCLALATEAQYFTEVAHGCEAKLAAAEPELVVPLFELFGEPGLTAVELDTVGVIEVVGG